MLKQFFSKFNMLKIISFILFIVSLIMLIIMLTPQKKHEDERASYLSKTFGDNAYSMIIVEDENLFSSSKIEFVKRFAKRIGEHENIKRVICPLGIDHIEGEGRVTINKLSSQMFRLNPDGFKDRLFSNPRAQNLIRDNSIAIIFSMDIGEIDAKKVVKLRSFIKNMTKEEFASFQSTKVYFSGFLFSAASLAIRMKLLKMSAFVAWLISGTLMLLGASLSVKGKAYSKILVFVGYFMLLCFFVATPIVSNTINEYYPGENPYKSVAHSRFGGSVFVDIYIKSKVFSMKEANMLKQVESLVSYTRRFEEVAWVRSITDEISEIEKAYGKSFTLASDTVSDIVLYDSFTDSSGRFISEDGKVIRITVCLGVYKPEEIERFIDLILDKAEALFFMRAETHAFCASQSLFRKR